MGNLLSTAPTRESTEEPGARPAKLSPGMATLLRAGNGNGKEQIAAEEPERARVHRSQIRVLRYSLLLADALLVVLALTLALRSKGGIGACEMLFCACALVLGAWLACLALWLE